MSGAVTDRTRWHWETLDTQCSHAVGHGEKTASQVPWFCFIISPQYCKCTREDQLLSSQNLLAVSNCVFNRKYIIMLLWFGVLLIIHSFCIPKITNLIVEHFFVTSCVTDYLFSVLFSHFSSFCTYKCGRQWLKIGHSCSKETVRLFVQLFIHG